MPIFEIHHHAPSTTPGPDRHAARRSWLDAVIEADRAEPARADAKASLLLVVPSAGIGLGAGQLGGLPLPAAVLAWSAVAAAVAAAGFLGAVVWPQLRGVEAHSVPALIAAAQAAGEDPEVDLTARAVEAARLRRLIVRKYRLLRMAIMVLGVALLLAVAAVAAG